MKWAENKNENAIYLMCLAYKSNSLIVYRFCDEKWFECCYLEQLLTITSVKHFI